MTANSAIALFGAMAVLALVPSVSVLAVSTRSATAGFAHGAFTAMGIVAGDIVFILLAILGLTALAETMDNLFVLVKYVGGAYLIFLGIKLWKSKSKEVEAAKIVKSSLLSSFLTGLFITLGDQKAILFYLGFFPAFVDLSTVSYLDVSIVITIAIVAVGGVKLGYAFLACRAGSLLHPKAIQGINFVAGSIMIAIGVFLIVKA